jgi:hypothetical protein
MYEVMIPVEVMRGWQCTDNFWASNQWGTELFKDWLVEAYTEVISCEYHTFRLRHGWTLVFESEDMYRWFLLKQ